MANPRPDTDYIGIRPGRGSTTSTPRWVKVFGMIAIVLFLLVIIMMFTGHGPGRHLPSGDAAGHTLPSTITNEHTPPEEGSQ